MRSSNFTDKDWLSCLSLTNKLPAATKPRQRHKPQVPYPDTCVTSAQRRRFTAIQLINKRTVELNQQVLAKLSQFRKFGTNDLNAKSQDAIQTPRHLREEITALRRKIYREKYRLATYQENRSLSTKLHYRPATLFFQSDDNAFIWLKGLLSNLYMKRRRFVDKDTLAMSGNDQDSNAWSRLRRLAKWTPNAFKVHQDDGRWLILFMRSCLKRLEREHAQNSYLPQEKKFKPEGQTFWEHWSYEELEAMSTMRAIQRLADNPWIQLREDERDYLCKLTLSLKTHFQGMFVVTKSLQICNVPQVVAGQANKNE